MNNKMPFYKYNTIIIGSGAAGFNAAVMLHQMGQTDIALITEGRYVGTSRNTGSDKQTYYKMTLCGKEPDSVGQMAKTLFDGGCMDGDIAMAEAAGSLRAFFHLVEIGVPFPFNQSGEYVGYKTDHDPLRRGISAGPLTSKYMTECLEKQVEQLNIPIYDGYQVIKLITETEHAEKKAVGVMAFNKKACEKENERYAVFSAVNIIWATGGEAGMYQSSVYPVSQTGGLGVLFQAGAVGRNLTEAQFGIASVKFRWNLSGTFQQCIPRYVSTNVDGSEEREFLNEYFDTAGQLFNAIFLKGYQWPFDPQKTWNNGSSLIDLLVYQEQVLKGRLVYLDFIHNPMEYELDGKRMVDLLEGEAKEYLEKCSAYQQTPYERLKHMNQSAIEVYSNHQIDLSKEYLEIALCAQHSNGGISGNQWWESNIKHLFVVGEANGSHGVYRPGGSALNSGQVGSIRASQYIANNYRGEAREETDFWSQHEQVILKETQMAKEALNVQNEETLDVQRELDLLRIRMTTYGASIRSEDGIRKALEENRNQRKQIGRCHKLNTSLALAPLYKLQSLLISQFVYLQAMQDYGRRVGVSRGSFLVHHPDGQKPHERLDGQFRNITGETDNSVLQEISYDSEADACEISWRKVRPLLENNDWFENIWKDFQEDVIIK